jgi:hypothetical protein
MSWRLNEPLEPDSSRTLRITGTALVVMGVVGMLAHLAKGGAGAHYAMTGVVYALMLGVGIWMRRGRRRDG